MSTKKIYWIIVSSIIVLFISGCRCDNAAVEAFVLIADSPIGGTLVSSLTPEFDWHGSDSCDPDQYRLYIREDNIYGGDTASPEVAYTDVPYTLTGDSLLPGRVYFWYGKAVNVWSSEEPGASGEFSEPEYFFTGPVCSGEVLIAPDLMDPHAAGWLSKEHIFKWTYTGGCLPVSYDVQFARDAGFTDIYLTANTTEPYVQELLMAFPDCSTMFWRVRASDGTTTGPWSDSREFHYVISDGCYQWNYISDDAARIFVRLYDDRCPYTGDPAGMRLSATGCKVDKDGVTLVGDGERTYPPDGNLSDVEVDLGSGPCPSTGLDHKTTGGVTFNVLAPGTYCVSVTRNQIVDHGSTNLMHGIWTDPRTNEYVAYKTVEIGPGTSDVEVYFGWDKYDHVILMPRLPETKYCRICPDPIGPVVDILMEGSMVELYGRARNSEWKSTYFKGVPCYLWLLDEKINAELSQFEDFDWRAQDLEFYSDPAPCPKPEKPDQPDQPDPESGPTCSDYTTRSECGDHKADGCAWSQNTNTCLGP